MTHEELWKNILSGEKILREHGEDAVKLWAHSFTIEQLEMIQTEMQIHIDTTSPIVTFTMELDDIHREAKELFNNAYPSTYKSFFAFLFVVHLIFGYPNTIQSYS